VERFHFPLRPRKTFAEEFTMKRAILPVCLSLLFILLVPSCLFCQEKLDIQAKIWDYGTICEFKDPEFSSGYEIKPTTEKVTLEVTNCRTFEQKQGHPAAVRVTLKNPDKTPMDVPIERDLASVSLNTKDNQAIPAIAKRAMVEGPMGGKKMEFVTKVDASYMLKLQPGQEVNIVYLFPKAAAGDTIKIGKLKPAKVE